MACLLIEIQAQTVIAYTQIHDSKVLSILFIVQHLLHQLKVRINSILDTLLTKLSFRISSTKHTLFEVLLNVFHLIELIIVEFQIMIHCMLVKLKIEILGIGCLNICCAPYHHGSYNQKQSFHTFLN